MRDGLLDHRENHHAPELNSQTLKDHGHLIGNHQGWESNRNNRKDLPHPPTDNLHDRESSLRVLKARNPPTESLLDLGLGNVSPAYSQWIVLLNR